MTSPFDSTELFGMFVNTIKYIADLAEEAEAP